jgi:hypothetical protein
VGLRIEPAFRTVSYGEPFVQHVVVDAGSQGVAAADVFIDFDPTLLEVVSIDEGAGLDIFVAKIDPSAGQVDVGAGNLGSPAHGTLTLVTLNMKAKDGTGSVSTAVLFSISGARTTVVRDELGNNVLDQAEGASVTVADATPTKTATPTATDTSTPTMTPLVWRLWLPLMLR